MRNHTATYNISVDAALQLFNYSTSCQVPPHELKRILLVREHVFLDTRNEIPD
uniref:Uncharacterized protein n=1 Tax=Arundo donax TaxID=35708 RepID=A0A0A9A694_ARUDO